MSPSSTPTASRSDLLSLSVPANSTFVRIHQAKDAPVWFGPKPGLGPAYRFDAPAGEYRTLYAAQHIEGAFAETMLRHGRRIVARGYVEQRMWTVLSNARDLKLIKLFDEGLVWHGVTADITTGDDYAVAQRFATDFHARFHDLDGIAYRSRHNNGQICYALFDRLDPTHLQIVDGRRFADEHAVTERLMRMHNASWDPLTPIPPP